MRKKNIRPISILLHVAFLVISLASVYPLIWTISSSLKTNREMYSGSIRLLPTKFEWSFLKPSHWGQLTEVLQFENYSRAWFVANFSQYFVNTVFFTLSVVIIVILLCALTGYVLGRYEFPGKFIIMGAIIATMFIPAGYTIIPLWQLINALGLGKSMAGLILAEAGGTHVLYILLFSAFFAGIPKELEESGQMDGAGFVRTFFTIMLPLAKPVIATTFILQFINTWNSFFIPLVFTIHRPDLRTLGVGMYSFG